MALFASGSFTKVPTLLGNNENEGTLLVLPAAPTTAAGYVAFEETQFAGHGAAIVAEYPVSAYGGSYDAASADALTDGSFVCPARRVARAIAGSGTATFRYDFDHAIHFILPGLGAFHGSELLFVFGNSLEGTTLSPAEVPLSQAIMGYWGAMAVGGDPNGGGRFPWPPFAAGSEAQIVLDLTLSTVSAFKKAKCDFWDGLEKW
jgi:para-nitrobenzyl esterase